MFSMLLESNSIPLPIELAVQLREYLKTRASDAALFVQQLHYWISKKQGLLHDGKRWIYNSYDEWREQLRWLTEWDFRVITSTLKAHGLIEFKQLASDKRDRTGYYTINYDHDWIKLETISDNSSDASESYTPMHPSGVLDSRTENTSENTSEITNSDGALLENDEEFIGAAILSGSTVASSLAPYHFHAPFNCGVLSVGESRKLMLDSPTSLDTNIADSLEESTILNEVRSCVPLNPTLQRLVLSSAVDAVQNAITYYRKVVKEKGDRKNPAGWLTDCLRGKWWLKEPTLPITIAPAQPNLEQLEQLKSMGRVLGLGGVVYVVVGNSAIPWQQAMIDLQQ